MTDEMIKQKETGVWNTFMCFMERLVAVAMLQLGGGCYASDFICSNMFLSFSHVRAKKPEAIEPGKIWQ